MKGMISAIVRSRHYFLSHIYRFAKDRSGVGAVEFAIIFPVLLALYLSSFELTIAYNTYKRASTASAAINDLVSKTGSVDKTYLRGMKDVTAAVYAPYKTNGLKLRISGVKVDQQKQAKIVWSWDEGDARPYAVGSPVDVPTGLLVQGSFLIHVELAVQHDLFLFRAGASSSTTSIMIGREYFFKQRDAETTCSDC